MKALVPMLAICACVVAAGCGSDEPSPSSVSSVATNAAEISNDEPGPSIEVPKGPPPKKLIVKDLKVGHGPAAKVGDEVTVEDIGVYWDGHIYSNSWTLPRPPIAVLGDHVLAYGVDMAVRGMRVGGRRKVLVPNRLIYYPTVKHHAPLRPGNGLEFLVELVNIG